MFRFRNLPFLLCLYACLGADACHDVSVPDAYPALGQACSLATDQEESFSTRVRQLPIRILIDREFGASQREQIAKAAEQWNLFSQASLGIVFFKVDEDLTADFSQLPGGSAYCTTKVKRQAGLVVVRVDSTRRWASEYGESEEVGGGTWRCKAGTVEESTEQLVAINTSSGDSTRLPSVILHELGHVIGLHHSCTLNSLAASKFMRSCDGIGSDDPYYKAVMYPELKVTRSAGYSSMRPADRKENLRANDMERVVCLYTGQTRYERNLQKAKQSKP